MSTLVLTRRRSSRWSMLALAAAAATALAVYSYLSYLRAQVPIAGPMAQMVVAARDIDSGELIQAGMLRLEDHPGRYLPQGVFEEIETVAGRVAAVPILSGDAVTERKVGKTGGASSVVPPGMRAYSLSAEAVSGLAILPRAGDRVDVLVTYETRDEGPVTQTILRSAKVASLRSEEAEGGGPLKGISGRGAGLTILVTPAQAEDLAMAESMGRIAVVLAPNELEPVLEDPGGPELLLEPGITLDPLTPAVPPAPPADAPAAPPAGAPPAG